MFSGACDRSQLTLRCSGPTSPLLVIYIHAPTHHYTAPTHVSVATIISVWPHPRPRRHSSGLEDVGMTLVLFCITNTSELPRLFHTYIFVMLNSMLCDPGQDLVQSSETQVQCIPLSTADSDPSSDENDIAQLHWPLCRIVAALIGLCAGLDPLIFAPAPDPATHTFIRTRRCGMTVVSIRFYPWRHLCILL
jgi:hypothetical protein